MGKIDVRVAALLIRDGQVLLVNHVKGGASYWVLPGGRVEFGETLPAALVREMKEELDLDVGVGPLAIVHDLLAEDRHVVNHVFHAEACLPEFRLRPTNVLKDARWVPLDELRGIDLRPAIGDELRKAAENPADRAVYLGEV